MVSIVIPTYNTPSHLLHRCIKSVSKGVAPRQIIVVDDCSDQPVGDIAGVEILRLDSRTGPAGARMAGIKAAKGEWLTFVDADDTLSADAIDAAFRCSKGVDIVQMEVVNRVTRLHLPYRRGGVDIDRAFEAVMCDDTLFPIHCCGKLYRKSIIDNARFINYNGRWGEDRVFNIAIMEQSPRIAICHGARYNYYWDSGVTKGKRRSHLDDIKRVYEIKKQYLLNNYKGENRAHLLEGIDREAVKFLEYEIRLRMNDGTYQRPRLAAELSSPPWNEMATLDDIDTIEKRNHNSILRKIKRLAFRL